MKKLSKDVIAAIVLLIFATIFMIWLGYVISIREVQEIPQTEPTSAPTVKPTIEPTDIPTSEPTIEPTIVPTETPTPEPTIEPIPEEVLLDDSLMESARYIAKTVYGEARGCSTIQQAAVIWCILNRVDSDYYPNDIISVVTQPSQFHGYDVNHPVTPDIYNLTIDVLTRWMKEKSGETAVGRVLPKEYLYFYSNGAVNIFTDVYHGGNTWDWRLSSPYV